MGDVACPQYLIIFEWIGTGLIHKAKVGNDSRNLIVGQFKVRHAGRARHDKGARVCLTPGGNNIGQVWSHVAAEAIELVAGDTVLVLKYLLAVASCIAHRITECGGSTAGVDGGRIDDESYAQRAYYGSIVDAPVSPTIGDP